MQIFDYNGCGVYKILNTITNKCYIGISKHCQERIKQHIRELNANRHPNCHLQSSWNKYGEKHFVCSIIEKFDLSETDKNHVLLREIYWIYFYDSCNNGYNQSYGGDGSTFVSFSKERSEKLSKKLKGRKYPQYSKSLSPVARKVVCLNNMKVYGSLVEAAEDTKTSVPAIIRSCKNKYPVSNNCDFVFSYYEDFSCLSKSDIEEIVASAKFKKENRHDLSASSVVCINTGKIFESGHLAAKKYGADYSYLLKCCKGIVASSGKSKSGEPMTWMFLEDYKIASKEDIVSKLRIALVKGSQNKPIKIKCITTNETFDNMNKAAKKYNLSQMSLSRHVRSDGVCGIHPITKEKLVWEIIN